ncbi:Methyl-accepting transducer domain-containing protein [Balamuthia mandrillaris]
MVRGITVDQGYSMLSIPDSFFYNGYSSRQAKRNTVAIAKEGQRGRRSGSRNKAKNELVQHLGDDPLPLRHAKIMQDIKKADKVAQVAAEARAEAAHAAQAASRARNEAKNAAREASIEAEAAHHQSEQAKAVAEEALEEARARLEEGEAYLEKAKSILPKGTV